MNISPLLRVSTKKHPKLFAFTRFYDVRHTVVTCSSHTEPSTSITVRHPLKPMTAINDLFDKVLAEVLKSGKSIDRNDLLRRLTLALPEGVVPDYANGTAVGSETPGDENTPEQRRPMPQPQKKTSSGRDGAPPVAQPRPILSCRTLREESRLTVFEEEIMYMDARRISGRNIRQSMKEVHGMDIPAARIAHITKDLRHEIQRWRTRPLERLYPVVYLDGLQLVEPRENVAAGLLTYTVVGITADGIKDVLGIWTAVDNRENLGVRILSELKMRGVEDIMYAFVDRIPLFREAFASQLPATLVHISVPGLVRDSLGCVPCNMRKDLGADLRSIFQAATLSEAESRLREMEERWYSSTPSLALLWHENWERAAHLFSYPLEVRRTFYQQHVIELLNSALRKVVRKQRLFPDDEALFTVFFLTLHGVAKKWSISLKDWHLTREWLLTRFPERMPTH